jgi:four helix bundle protein
MNDVQLAERTRAFALRIIRLVASLPRSPIAEVLGKQLLRAGTSVGANYREARRARSRADFVAKIGICTQESDESLYWLELLADSAIVRRGLLVPLCREADELVAIFTSSIITARKNKNIKPV